MSLLTFCICSGMAVRCFWSKRLHLSQVCHRTYILNLSRKSHPSIGVSMWAMVTSCLYVRGPKLSVTVVLANVGMYDLLTAFE